ncbi:MAG: hypothetical protein ACR2LR_21020 [Hassallia sp.]
MKRVSIASISAIALLTIPLIAAIPGVPSIWNLNSAIAQNTKNQGQLQLRLEAEKKIKKGEKITWQALQGQAVVQPGDVLRYTAAGENKSDRAVKNLTLNQPIPKGMQYVLKSATASSNAKITYSIDSARTFVENPTIQVKLANGKVETKPAPATAYTHIRMNFNESVPTKAIVKGIYEVQVR